jgi:tetratricopeptide (TPR) repeat protein
MRSTKTVSSAGFRSLIVVLALAGSVAAQTEPVAVEPYDLERRADLVGRVVTVDDRVKFYQFHAGRGYDELRLKRTDVVFRLPPHLRPEASPKPMPVIVQGQLVREGGELVCDVTSLKVLPNDLDRLEQAVAALSATDFENRKAWGAWAERRGKSFKPEDRPLVQRARSIQADALRIESEQKRGVVDAPSKWLELAEEGRRKRVDEPSPSALAHKAFQAKLAAAGRSDDLKSLLSAVERFFPQAAGDKDAGQVPLGRWGEAYANDPAGAYRSAPANLRKPLDRRLWADVLQRLLQQQAAEDPRSATSLATRSEAELPERPRLATELLELGLQAAQRDVGSLRLSEVKSIGQAYREKLGNPQAAIELYRKWLKVQRDRLSATDAEGPVALAGLFEELLQDRETARELLLMAWKIDPGSKEVAEAFRNRGYRKVKDEWVEATPGGSDGASNTPGAPESQKAPTAVQIGLRGRTVEEVKRQLGGEPERKSFSGTKGQLIEQWLFLESTRVHYVNFLHTPGEARPRVVSDYFLPRSLVKGDLRSPR